MNSVCRLLRPHWRQLIQAQTLISKRLYASPAKRFYKKTSVLFNDGKYEVVLDHRKLKTPKGAPFTLKSEPLAIAVGTEFANQKEYIERSKMHLSTLCFTAIDNPKNHTKIDMVNYMLNFMPTDTILFQYDDEKDLHDLQRNEWDPLIQWFNERYGTNLQKTMNITPPQVTAEDKMKVSKYLLSHTEDVQRKVDNMKEICSLSVRLSVVNSFLLSCCIKISGRLSNCFNVNCIQGF